MASVYLYPLLHKGKSFFYIQAILAGGKWGIEPRPRVQGNALNHSNYEPLVVFFFNELSLGTLVLVESKSQLAKAVILESVLKFLLLLF